LKGPYFFHAYVPFFLYVHPSVYLFILLSIHSSVLSTSYVSIHWNIRVAAGENTAKRKQKSFGILLVSPFSPPPPSSS